MKTRNIEKHRVLHRMKTPLSSVLRWKKGVEVRALKRAPAERARAFARICGPGRLSRKAYSRREASGVIFPFRPHRSQSPPGGVARNHPEATGSDLVAAANFDKYRQKQTNSRPFSYKFKTNSDAKTTLYTKGGESKNTCFSMAYVDRSGFRRRPPP